MFSVDGYIATPDGAVDWLHTAGNLDVDMGSEDMGFQAYMDSVDCMIMGRKCMETISGMNLTPEQWPYGKTKIIVLSQSIKEAPENMKGKIEIYAGEVHALIRRLENEDFKHAYIDGGTTITFFLNLRRINEITITQVPIILGEGIPLFGKIFESIKLDNARATVYANDFIHTKYRVCSPTSADE
ncbi:MAG: dihydrofolate reductase family protein [Ghiorsea sp.]